MTWLLPLPPLLHPLPPRLRSLRFRAQVDVDSLASSVVGVCGGLNGQPSRRRPAGQCAILPVHGCSTVYGMGMGVSRSSGDGGDHSEEHEHKG